MLNTSEYIEKVYAGVLGKIAGVYMGRPYESWVYEDIRKAVGIIRGYVNNLTGQPLVVPDDDLTGTFTFLRALQDHGFPHNLEPKHIANTWLNYVIEGKTIFWWGGLFHSSEHTAYLRLKKGILPPESGSVALNGEIIANQIGAQIFIDGWAMIAPGEPERAAWLAECAARVSHDDQAINAARLIAAMEALAFTENDLQRLLDGGLAQIPRDSLIARLVQDVREWHSVDPDWHTTFHRIEQQYGYHVYKGGCHVVPNHALILLGLLYGRGDLQESLSIVCSAGWDTDCNAGNLGCLLGIRNGLRAFEGDMDWRSPIADRLYLPTADGGRCVTDAAREALKVVNAGRALHDLPPVVPKGGARFHFALPGSVQGFMQGSSLEGAAEGPNNQAGLHAPIVTCQNVAGHSREGQRSLQLSYYRAAYDAPARAGTATFIRPEDISREFDYDLLASPTLYSGQKVHCSLSLDNTQLEGAAVNLYIMYYNENDQPALLSGPSGEIQPGQFTKLDWTVPDTNGGPIFEVGLEVRPTSLGHPPVNGSLYLDFLQWDGSPLVNLKRPSGSQLPKPGPLLWRRAWVSSVDLWEPWHRQALRIIQNEGRGLLSTGAYEWADYSVSTVITSAKFSSGGIAARVQGLRRFYALQLVEGGTVRLLRALNENTILWESEFDWKIWQPYELRLEVHGDRLRGWIDGSLLFDLRDTGSPLTSGGVALVVEEGHLAAPEIRVGPVM